METKLFLYDIGVYGGWEGCIDTKLRMVGGLQLVNVQEIDRTVVRDSDSRLLHLQASK